MKTYYTSSEAVATLGITRKTFDGMIKRKVVQSIAKGKWDKEKIDTFAKELEERRKVAPPNWVNYGTGV
jgi:hypothetical protein